MSLIHSRQFCPTTTLFDPFHNSRNSHGSSSFQLFRNQKQNRAKQQGLVSNYRKSRIVTCLGYSRSDKNGDSEFNGSSTVDKIVDKLKMFRKVSNDNDRQYNKRVVEKGFSEDRFYVEEEKTANQPNGFSEKPGLEVANVFRSSQEVRFPWEKLKDKEMEEREEEEKWTARRQSRFSLAEMTLPAPELRRLRNLTLNTKSRTRVRGGITPALLDTIKEKWKTSEIVRLNVEGASALNMKKMHEILEKRTGGLVIWRSGASISLYRGVTYEVPSHNKRLHTRNERFTNSIPETSTKIADKDWQSPQENNEANFEENQLLQPQIEYEEEVDKLLDGLGPRYTEWQGLKPLPVDADMLPGIVPGYRPPFRVLPYGMRSNLNRTEATGLRRLGKVLPPHFALGRSRQLQGLAVAMIKVWEECSIVKIALKRGVQLTSTERMAEEIKKLTGAMLLVGSRDFLVFYRGKDFLSAEVAESLLERERLAKFKQDDEEQARLKVSHLIVPSVRKTEETGAAGTLKETLFADARWGKKPDNETLEKELTNMRNADLIRKLEKKLAFAERRLLKAERALSKVEVFLQPSDRQADPESITDEERFMFRKLGLRMKAYLLLGRRGVFDGTVENMHLHWKYRELIKILVKAKNFEQVKKVALALESESGGVLVSVDKVSKGYAIIVYRGKDYHRPSTIRPKNLLTKRKALARSIELQRLEALTKHAEILKANVEKLKSEIKQVDLMEDKDELYDELNAAYSSEDEETTSEEEEEDEAYLETYDSENDEDETEIDRLISADTNFSFDGQLRELDTESD